MRDHFHSDSEPDLRTFGIADLVLFEDFVSRLERSAVKVKQVDDSAVEPAEREVSHRSPVDHRRECREVAVAVPLAPRAARDDTDSIEFGCEALDCLHV